MQSFISGFSFFSSMLHPKIIKMNNRNVQRPQMFCKFKTLIDKIKNLASYEI